MFRLRLLHFVRIALCAAWPLLLLAFTAQAQSITLNGRVLGPGAEPLPAATITLQQAAHSTLSRPDGSFTITAANTDTLLISAIGYQPKRIPVARFTGSRQPLTITLEPDIKSLRQVTVSTGYQELPKERATGSFDLIGKQQFNEQVSSDIISRLEAIANAVNVDRITGSSPRLQVRGLSTIRGPRDPLIIVDNFPYEGDINNINPNEVESISILKDAAAASIWGSRAGNGVIVITTKKAKLNHSPEISFNYSITTERPPDLFYMKQMTPADYIEVEQFLFSKGYGLDDTASALHPPFTPVYEILLEQQNGQLSTTQAEAMLNKLRLTDIRNDFNQYCYKPALNSQYYVSLRGGSTNADWLLSLGYDDNKNSLSATYKRINLRLENSTHIGKKIELSAGLYATRSASHSGKPGFGEITTINGNLPLYTTLADENGNPLPVMKDYRSSWSDTVGNGTLENWNYFPLTDYQHSITNTNLYDWLLNSQLQYKPFSWLTASFRYQFEKQETVNQNLHDPESYYTRDLVNRFTQIGNNNPYPVPKGDILDRMTQSVVVQNARFMLNGNHAWQKQSITTLAGIELRQANSLSFSNRTYGYNPEMLSFIPVDFANPYPTLPGGADNFVPDGTSFNDAHNRFVSVFANVAYTYQNRYTFTLSGRRDASNLYGIKTNDKWQPLGSVGFAWNISREPFYKSRSLPFVKMRFTYGVSGNTDLSQTAVTTIGYISASPYTQSPQAIINQVANPQLKWEKVRMMNVGLDFAFAGDRITGSLEYYHKSAIDLFGSAPIDYTTGVGTSITKNVASMKANGWDADINILLLKHRFRWEMQLTCSVNKDKVVDYYLPALQASNFISPGQPRISAIQNKPVYAIYSYPWAGLDPSNGDPLGYINGHPSKDYNALTGPGVLVTDVLYNGPALPSVFGSFGNSFLWKRFSLNLRFQYKFGYYFRRSSIEYNTLFTVRQGHSDYALRWQNPGDEAGTNVPSMVYPAISKRDAFYNGSEVLIEKGDHIRLRYINLSYTLDKDQWKKLPFKSLQVFTTADNVGIIWRANDAGIDPDAPTAIFPPALSISIGCRISL